MRPVLIILAAALALGTVEGLAWWWMHPAATKQESAVLTYRPSASNSSFTPLPEVYQQAAPILRCTSGQVFYLKIHESAHFHGAFFEWESTDTGSVLEAYRHMPEACMGAIGLKLVSHEKIIPHEIDGHTLLFDHTIFSDPSQPSGPFAPVPLIHAFRAVWVEGIPTTDARQGLNGREFNRLRTIRLKSALARFRPGSARVVQGAVRGIPNPELAWQAFEQSMLKDLKFEKQ